MLIFVYVYLSLNATTEQIASQTIEISTSSLTALFLLNFRGIAPTHPITHYARCPHAIHQPLIKPLSLFLRPQQPPIIRIIPKLRILPRPIPNHPKFVHAKVCDNHHCKEGDGVGDEGEREGVLVDGLEE